MKPQTFTELTQRIINLSTRERKPISVTFSGTGAHTNPKTVNIPTLPSGTILTQSQFSIWLGYVIHEGPGHQTHTDLNLYESICRQKNNPKFSYLLNLLEDIRIENADIKTYPGDRKYLDSAHLFVDSKIPPALAKSSDIMGLIYKQLFVRHRNLDTHIIQGNLDNETARIISEIDFCSSTQDCINLAEKLFNYLNKKQEEEKQNPSPQENKNQTQSEKDEKSKDQNSNNNPEEVQEQSSGQGDEETSEENSNEPEPSDDGSENESESEKVEEEPSQTNSQENPGNSNEDEASPNPSYSFNSTNEEIETWQEITEIKNLIKELKDQFEKVLDKIPDQNLNGKSIFPPVDITNDRIYVPSREDLQTYNSTRLACSSQILSLKKMFRIYLQAQTKKSQIRGLDEGKLDHQRLFVVSTGSNLIFKDQSSKLLPETAIELMIDMSGSMNSKIARTSAIILSEALNSIPQIKLSISGFTTNNNNYQSRRGYYDINHNSGRVDGMDILQFKNFNEPYQKARAKLGAIKNSGMTPLGDAYGKSLEHIIPRPEPRRIIFLITDGKPEFQHGQNHSDYLLMKKVFLTAKKYNIQTLGLGIGDNTDFLSSYFDKSINITEIENLPKNLLEALKFFI